MVSEVVETPQTCHLCFPLGFPNQRVMLYKEPYLRRKCSTFLFSRGQAWSAHRPSQKGLTQVDRTVVPVLQSCLSFPDSTVWIERDGILQSHLYDT